MLSLYKIEKYVIRGSIHSRSFRWTSFFLDKDKKPYCIQEKTKKKTKDI